MNTLIGLAVVVVLIIMVVTGMFKKSEPVRDGDSSLTYDDYLELIHKLEQIHKEIEGITIKVY